MAGANEWLNTFPTFPNAQLSDGRCRSAYEIWLGAPQSILCGPAATEVVGGGATFIYNDVSGLNFGWTL